MLPFQQSSTKPQRIKSWIATPRLSYSSSFSGFCFVLLVCFPFQYLLVKLLRIPVPGENSPGFQPPFKRPLQIMCLLRFGLPETFTCWKLYRKEKKKREFMFWNQIYKNKFLFFGINSTKANPQLHFTAGNSLLGVGFSKGLWPLLCLQRVIKAGASREPESRHNWPLKFCFKPRCVVSKSILTTQMTSDLCPPHLCVAIVG